MLSALDAVSPGVSEKNVLGAVMADAVASSTIRYFAASRLVCARALLALATYARTCKDDFSLGPLDLAELENQGLVITGPDLTAVKEMLSKIPGLAEEEL